MRKRCVAIVALAAVGLIGVCIGGCETDSPTLRQALLPACEGYGVEEAATYTPGPDPSPIHIIYLTAGFDDWDVSIMDGRPAELPPEWWSNSVKDVQLVACVAEHKEETGQCGSYEGVWVGRYRTQVEIRVMEARTGKEIATRAFYGPDPRCPRAIYIIPEQGIEDITGPAVEFQEVESWLRGYVMWEE